MTNSKVPADSGPALACLEARRMRTSKSAIIAFGKRLAAGQFNIPRRFKVFAHGSVQHLRSRFSEHYRRAAGMASTFFGRV